ncbi:3-ketosteroid 5-isomerase [Sphingobium subterraneum]|uniref:Steroid delta-isomerase n=1 Tax=Sphingobium subterraneum TaxID=627688 RepID=A0A841J4Q5_9SPHN|nr:3-ketosteroid 5-isomerase [Sphingobium subterraneum]MBB6125322.1 steroid delta-isomerase [Sphingobium subterraneum]
MHDTFEIPAQLQFLLSTCTAGDVDPEHIKAVMHKYGECMGRGDEDGIAALFSPQSMIFDPVNAVPRPYSELRSFFRGAFDAQGGFIEMKVEGEVRVAGNFGAAAYIAVMTIDGMHVIVETLDIMKFGSDGLVESLHAYWGPSNIKPSPRAPQRA